jgi:(p)ppGpp synthase/HD superfamily hydrolase
VDDIEQTLVNIRLAPYIVKAMALIGVRRRAGSNMFRHQISTMGILIDYKIVDAVLLKAAVIHDLFEDAAGLPGVTEEEISRIDTDGPAVYALVMEVTHRNQGVGREPKAEYLLRIMQTGSWRAQLLKLADRISNITALGFVHDREFVRRYLQETRTYILPYAEQVNADMFRELSDLIANREQQLVDQLPEPRPATPTADDVPEREQALVEGPGVAEGRTDNKAGG